MLSLPSMSQVMLFSCSFHNREPLGTQCFAGGAERTMFQQAPAKHKTMNRG
jgi:hypothetical protein